MLLTAEEALARPRAGVALGAEDTNEVDGLGGKAVTRSANATDGLDMDSPVLVIWARTFFCKK